VAGAGCQHTLLLLFAPSNVHGEGRAPLLRASLSTVGLGHSLLGHSFFGFSLGHVAPIFKERKVDPKYSRISPLTSNDCPRGPRRSSTTLIGPRGNLCGGRASIKNPGYGLGASELLVKLQVKVRHPHPNGRHSLQDISALATDICTQFQRCDAISCRLIPDRAQRSGAADDWRQQAHHWFTSKR